MITLEERPQRAPGRLRHDGQGHDEDPVPRYLGLDGRRQDQFPDGHHQPQDGNRQLSGRPAIGGALAKENIKEAGLSRHQNFLVVV